VSCSPKLVRANTSTIRLEPGQRELRGSKEGNPCWGDAAAEAIASAAAEVGENSQQDEGRASSTTDK
jgi:hypothetical protein